MSVDECRLVYINGGLNNRVGWKCPGYLIRGDAKSRLAN